MTKKQKKKRLKLLIGIAAGLLLIAAGLFLNVFFAHRVRPLSQETLDQLDLSQTDKLMIVAHPDDEVLWGGGHLLDGGYLVICVTNGRDRTRAAEFRKAVTMTGNIPLILDYPDKVNFLRDSWDSVREGIEADLRRVIALKQWSLIVTHNQDGGYGHIHHKLTHLLTVQAYDALRPDCPLYCFGKYYRAAVLPEYEATLERIPEETLKRKREICRCYASQADVIKKLGHMLPYENWTLYRTNSQ
ncbi:MAG: PIG-L family deacetylase [Oscillospiraceae bacterium]|nr:PIG-L family deacetylase [Oscillospiraceae bacterium]